MRDDEKPRYTCPFCKTEIEDGVVSLSEHRKPGGDCDEKMAIKLKARANDG